ncbi:polysaccharide pyruvyl transferase family protein [Verrucomicrobiaceae bacterium 227]
MTVHPKPRIGVLTYHNGPNFGGFLQAWHLVHAIRALGYEAHAVNYLHKTHHESNQINIPLRNLSSLKGKIFWMLKKRGFRNIEDDLCRHPFVSDSSKVPWDDFDAFVVGSDVVWDYSTDSFGCDPVYFGGAAGLAGKPMIAYAASCGPADPKGPFPDHIKNGLERFTSIGVRDEATANLVKNASGRDSELVVDPTWLSPDPPSESVLNIKGKYLFAYGGNISIQQSRDLLDYCRSRNLLLVSALSKLPDADKMFRTLTPFQWVELFKNAEATFISGTLHGTIYSMKYGRPFILANAPATSAKIREILLRTSQNFRLFEPGEISPEDLSKLLDPKAVQAPELPASWISQSKKFLGKSLSESLSGLK